MYAFALSEVNLIMSRIFLCLTEVLASEHAHCSVQVALEDSSFVQQCRCLSNILAYCFSNLANAISLLPSPPIMKISRHPFICITHPSAKHVASHIPQPSLLQCPRPGDSPGRWPLIKVKKVIQRSRLPTPCKLCNQTVTSVTSCL